MIIIAIIVLGTIIHCQGRRRRGGGGGGWRGRIHLKKKKKVNKTDGA